MSRNQKLWYQYSRAFLVGFGIAFLTNSDNYITSCSIWNNAK